MGFRIICADITKLKVDAIVNPTDQYFSGGGGVDWLIHDICGPELRRATHAFRTLHLGEARATEGFSLPCKYIIHTSGPRWRDSHFLEVSLLGSCYRNSVQLAHSLGCKSIAFPLISSRGKHFPKQQALTTAINAILECVDEYPDMEIILTIYVKWVETIPEGFFDWLSGYVLDEYKPGAELVEPEYVERPRRVMKREVAEDFSHAADIRDYGICMNEASPQILQAPTIDPELLKKLMDNPTQKNLDQVQVDENFAEMLNRLIEERGTKTNEVLDALSLSSAALSKLRNAVNNPSKLTVFALAIFFELPIEQTEEMLMKAGYAINPSSIQDVILSACIRNGIYDRYAIDELLVNLDLVPLPGSVVD